MKLPQKNIDEVIPFLQLFVDEVEDARIETLSLRKRLNIKIIIYVFAMIILGLGLVGLNKLPLPNAVYHVSQWVIILGLFLTFYQIDALRTTTNELQKQYIDTFKNELYSITTSTLQPTWNYQPTFDLQKNELIQSDIFSENVNIYRTTYCLEGDFDLFPLKAYKVEATINNDTHNLVITNYSGIFIKIQLVKTTNYRAIIAPRISSQNFNSNSSHKLNLHQKGYELHSDSEVTFNRYFKIYNTQNYDLPEMLTPTLQRQLAHFVLNHKKEVYLSFQKDKLYISIKTDEKSVLPSLKGDVSPKIAAEHFYNELKVTLDLLKRMK